MKSIAAKFFSVTALLSLGVHFAASQDSIPFTTFFSPFFYDVFPDYNGNGLQPACSATYYDTAYPVAEITTAPGPGVFLVSITLESATETQVYIYTSDPADSTRIGCLYEYYTAPATAFSFSIVLTVNYTQLYTIILTKPDQDGVSGTFSLDPEPGSTLPGTSTTPPSAGSSTPPLTTEAPVSSPTPSSTPATTTQAPASSSAAPTSQPATTGPTTTQALLTSSPHVPSTTPGATSQIPLTTPGATSVTPSTTPALPSSTPPTPSTTPALPTTTPPPTTGTVKVTLTVNLTPNPPQAGQPLIVSGDAVASSGPAPTGNVTVYVDGVPVATAPVIPSRSGRRSLFSVTVAAPNTRGAHTIVVVFSPTSSRWEAAPVTIQVDVVGAAATVDLVLSSADLVFPSCLKPLEAVAWVSGANGSTAPTGTVTLGMSGANLASLGANLKSLLLGTAPVVASAATFDLHFSDALKFAAVALKDSNISESDAELLPGSYQLTACYSGDNLYGPACGSAPLTVGPKCSHFSLTMFGAHS